MKISKAIIPVAGWGTRRLPITKSIEKCMLPIGNRPIVDYVVRDCLQAGINEIIFVVGEQSQQIRDYYSSNPALDSYLQRTGKAEKLNLTTPPHGVKFHFVVQPDDGKYGTAVPVGLAAPYVPADESALILMGDDFIYNRDGSSEIARLLEAITEGSCALLAAQVARSEVSRYGVIEQDIEGNYLRIVEKPSPESAPSNLINISKYVLSKSVIDQAASVKVSARGEYELTDVVNNYVASGGVVKVVPAGGEYLDGGSVEGWLHANQVVVGQTD